MTQPAQRRDYPATLGELLPVDLLELPRWIVWKLERRGKGKATKVPYSVRTGRHASVTNPRTWTPFGDACEAYASGEYAGLGFVLGEGICGVDLDTCRDPDTGLLAPWALAMVRELASYTEISPSGAGVHILIRGELPAGSRRRGQVEMYDRERFLTITGERLADTPATIETRTGELAAIHARIFAADPASSSRPASPAPSSPALASDTELILKAHNASNGAAFARLWSGDTSGYTSASEADMSLCARLAFWAGPDASRIDRLYRQSGLYADRAGKWDRKLSGTTYGARTIERVLASPRDYYTPRAAAPAIAPTRQEARQEAQELAADRQEARAPRGRSDKTDGAAPSPHGEIRRIPGTRWYLSPDRSTILESARSSAQEGEEGEELAGYRPVYDWPAPTIHALIKFPTEEAPAGRQVVYDVEIDGQRERIAYEELHKGECWGRYGTLGIAGRAAIASMAATVEYIARVSEAPRYPGTRHTGWTVRDGRHAMVLPNGRLVASDGVMGEELAYLAIAARHVAPYPEGLAIASDPAAQSAALAFVAGASSRSLAALVLCAHVRSILYGALRSDFSVLVRGTSGRGKTSITSFARNLTGDFTGWPPPAATAAFSATVTTVEDDASQIKHLPLTVDDLAISERMTLADQAEKAKILDMVLRSVGNNTAVRERMTRNLERQIPRKIDACPVITAERLPEVLASALNRTVLLDIGEGDVNKDAMKTASNEHAAGLRGVGYGLLAWIAGEWDRQGEELAASWACWHTETARTIEEDVIRARNGRPIPDNATRLPSNAAHLLLAAHVLDSYADAHGIDNPITPAVLYPDLIAHLVTQIDTIASLETGGNDGQPLGEWISEHIRAALARAEAHIKNADGSPAIEGEAQAPENVGYRMGAAGYDGRGVYLGNFTHDKTAIALDAHNLYELLKRAGRADRRTWNVRERELGKTLHRAGLLITDDDGHHIARLVRICGKVTRRLCIPCEMVWPDYGEEAIETGEELAPAIREAIERERARDRIEAPRIERQEGEELTQDRQEAPADMPRACVHCGAPIDVAGNPVNASDTTPLCYDCAARAGEDREEGEELTSDPASSIEWEEGEI